MRKKLEVFIVNKLGDVVCIYRENLIVADNFDAWLSVIEQLVPKFALDREFVIESVVDDEVFAGADLVSYVEFEKEKTLIFTISNRE